MRVVVFSLGFFAGLLAWSGLRAEGVTAPAAPVAPAEAAPKKNVRPAKGKRSREKEAEGTEALDRFEANTVIKSHYQLNGEPLEVDPD
ncbi:MAG: hypothetical protein NDJ89_12065 [Oligoflexia bacterium]|nr:hypothetical protein [Oligoflexia bacterium]